MDSEIDELAMVDRGDERIWTQSTLDRLTSDDIVAAMAALPDEPRAHTSYDYTLRWDWATAFDQPLRVLPSTPIAITTVAPPGRLWRRYQRNCARRDRDERARWRARARHRRQVRAAFRRRKRGLT